MDSVDRVLAQDAINNILAVLSKPLKYAADCVLEKAPKVGLFKVERPEIVA